MNLRLKYIIYLTVILSGVFTTKINSMDSYPVSPGIDKTNNLVFTVSKERSKQDNSITKDQSKKKQSTYRRCYQPNSLVEEVSAIKLMIYTCFKDLQSLDSRKIEFYISVTKDIRIGLPIPKIIYPFNYFWGSALPI